MNQPIQLISDQDRLNMYTKSFVLEYTYHIPSNTNDSNWLTIKSSYNAVENTALDRAIVTIINACYAQKRTVFCMTREGLRTLMKNDKNWSKNKRKSFKTDEWSDLLRKLYHMETIRLLQTGTNKTASVFEFTDKNFRPIIDCFLINSKNDFSTQLAQVSEQTHKIDKNSKMGTPTTTTASTTTTAATAASRLLESCEDLFEDVGSSFKDGSVCNKKTSTSSWEYNESAPDIKDVIPVADCLPLWNQDRNPKPSPEERYKLMCNLINTLFYYGNNPDEVLKERCDIIELFVCPTLENEQYCKIMALVSKDFDRAMSNGIKTFFKTPWNK